MTRVTLAIRLFVNSKPRHTTPSAGSGLILTPCRRGNFGEGRATKLQRHPDFDWSSFSGGGHSAGVCHLPVSQSRGLVQSFVTNLSPLFRVPLSP